MYVRRSSSKRKERRNGEVTKEPENLPVRLPSSVVTETPGVIHLTATLRPCLLLTCVLLRELITSRVPFGGIRNRWWCKAFEYPSNKMADTYDVDDTGGWDATHEAAAAAAAAHAAGECFHVLVIFLDTCVPAVELCVIVMQHEHKDMVMVSLELNFAHRERRDGICMM